MLTSSEAVPGIGKLGAGIGSSVRLARDREPKANKPSSWAACLLSRGYRGSPLKVLGFLECPHSHQARTNPVQATLHCFLKSQAKWEAGNPDCRSFAGKFLGSGQGSLFEEALLVGLNGKPKGTPQIILWGVPVP